MTKAAVIVDFVSFIFYSLPAIFHKASCLVHSQVQKVGISGSAHSECRVKVFSMERMRLGRRLRRVLLIINLKTLLITLLAVASTAFCRHYQIYAEFPLTLIATSVVFPIVFSIGGAYKRREAALDKYGTLKAYGRAIYLASRDWLPGSTIEIQEEAKSRIGEVLMSCRTMFTSPTDEIVANEKPVYESFSKLSNFIKVGLRAEGLPSGECSRCNQYVSKMLLAFEDVKHIYQYRTPRTLAAFSDIFIRLLPPLYGPYFAAVGKGYSHVGLIYAMPVVLSVILVSLDNIQEHLENPFDQVGEDDVEINAQKFIESLKPVTGS